MEVPPEDRVARAAPGPLKGRTYVVTGTLESMTREAATQAIEQLGGKVAGSVSKKTTAVIVGADAGTKAVKARELGVPILDEAGFQDADGDGVRERGVERLAFRFLAAAQSTKMAKVLPLYLDALRDRKSTRLNSSHRT